MTVTAQQTSLNQNAHRSSRKSLNLLRYGSFAIVYSPTRGNEFDQDYTKQPLSKTVLGFSLVLASSLDAITYGSYEFEGAFLAHYIEPSFAEPDLTEDHMKSRGIVAFALDCSDSPVPQLKPIDYSKSDS